MCHQLSFCCTFDKNITNLDDPDNDRSLHSMMRPASCVSMYALLQRLVFVASVPTASLTDGYDLGNDGKPIYTDVFPTLSRQQT